MDLDKPVLKNAPESNNCNVCGFAISKGNFAFYSYREVYCSKKCVRKLYPDFGMGQPANLSVSQKIKRLEREIRMLRYSIDQMTNIRKGKLKELNELRKELTSKKAFEVLAK